MARAAPFTPRMDRQRTYRSSTLQLVLWRGRSRSAAHRGASRSLHDRGVRDWHGMPKGRLEAFSDGVVAIIITIMVLEMKVPEGENLEAIWPLWPVFVSYILS